MVIRFIFLFFIIGFCVQGNCQNADKIRTFEMDGRERSYFLHLPENITKNAPLVFTLHGYGGDAKSMMTYSKMNEVADKNGFAVCYPQGYLGPDQKNSWNAGYSNDAVDDVKFLTALAKHLQQTYHLSAQNTFVTGMSNGGDMCYVLACQAPDVFAGIAPVAGCMMETTFKTCNNKSSIPVFEMHGIKDEITLWKGDVNYSEEYGGYLGTREIIDFWVEKNKTTTVHIDTLFDFNTSDSSYIVSERHLGGTENKQVWLYKIEGGKHDWPGTWGNMDIQASEVIWSFFEQFVAKNDKKYTLVDNHFNQATPESLGVSSKGILSFLERAEQEIDALHSFMVIRKGKNIAQGWWDPYDAKTPHVMHSLSKSFTSTAIGFLYDEGKIKLEDRVLSFFPEYKKEPTNWQWNAMRIRDLLTMNTGHIEEPMVWSQPNNWASFFLSSEVPLGPGTHFKYNSAATYMLAVILEKITGEHLVDYLTPRLFKPLNIEKPHWDVSPDGINTGGWGLSITTEDIAKLGQFYLQEGKWNGQQILSKKWVEMATSKQVANGSDPNNDWNQGYGFQFWRCRHNAFRGDGAMGQFCIVVPEKELVIAITSGTYDLGHVMNLVWEEILPGIQSNPLPENPLLETQLKTKLTRLKLSPVKGNLTPSNSFQLEKKEFVVDSNTEGIQSILFSLHDENHTITLTNKDGKETIEIGHGYYKKGILKTNLPFAKLQKKKIAASGAWVGPNEYQLRIYFYEMPERINYNFRFEGDMVNWESNLEHALFGTNEKFSLKGSIKQ